MECVKCGHENSSTALLCYWCGLDPATGKQPYQALSLPDPGAEGALGAISLPTIEVPPPIPVPDVKVSMAGLDFVGMTMPDLPTIEIAPPPDVSDLDRFSGVQRRRMRHRPIVRVATPPPQKTRPVLPGSTRLMVFLAGLGVLYFLGAALATAVGAASFGSAFCLLGILGLVGVLWVGLLLARTGRRIAAATGEVYERLELLGRALREVAPGKVVESPVNLPTQLGVLDLPVAYSELRYLAGQEGESPADLAVDLLTGAIVSLVGRDDAILARRTYPVQVQGLMAQPSSHEVNQPILTRRRVYVGPGRLEEEVAKILRTDHPVTIQELIYTLLGPDRRQQAKRIVDWVGKALSENPPDLEALSSPDSALAEMEEYRQALRRADSELYQLVEDQVRRGLGAAVQRSTPSSLLDLARYASSEHSRQSRRRNSRRD